MAGTMGRVSDTGHGAPLALTPLRPLQVLTYLRTPLPASWTEETRSTGEGAIKGATTLSNAMDLRPGQVAGHNCHCYHTSTTTSSSIATSTSPPPPTSAPGSARLSSTPATTAAARASTSPVWRCART